MWQQKQQKFNGKIWISSDIARYPPISEDIQILPRDFVKKIGKNGRTYANKAQHRHF
ncbi:TPA: hypothetical protein ACUL8R_001899 [Haemophilus influenzae]|uniref:hypothetical protein n=1 Tax=Haemophilus influenzae TaxID=727 RepID=UPI000A58D7EB|nr:hypothetical protein [Haemophilus influenzae]